ncbi:hypothetical protein ACFVFS_35240 [Kitasatospora sp. NPDC057692]|uniref:hypothetical protein n=1 Tax=Kitasatospora sp. NPDC057692 TaxID=3346215 RepID=UPI00368FD732
MRDTEDMVRGALRDEMARVEVADWSAGPVQAHVRRQRRGRRVAVGASALAAALAVVAGTGAVLSAERGSRIVGPASSASRAPSVPLVPAEPAPEPLVVEPGRQLSLERPNWWMQLKDQEICVHDAPAYGSGPGCAGSSWAPGTTGITMKYSGVPPLYGEALYNLVYHGPGKVARMTMELDGRAYWAVVASLPGSPGYASGYVWGPGLKPSDDAKPDPFQGIRLVAYDAQGTVLADDRPST